MRGRGSWGRGDAPLSTWRLFLSICGAPAGYKRRRCRLSSQKHRRETLLCCLHSRGCVSRGPCAQQAAHRPAPLGLCPTPPPLPRRWVLESDFSRKSKYSPGIRGLSSFQRSRHAGEGGLFPGLPEHRFISATPAAVVHTHLL